MLRQGRQDLLQKAQGRVQLLQQAEEEVQGVSARKIMQQGKKKEVNLASTLSKSYSDVLCSCLQLQGPMDQAEVPR